MVLIRVQLQDLTAVQKQDQLVHLKLAIQCEVVQRKVFYDTRLSTADDVSVTAILPEVCA